MRLYMRCPIVCLYRIKIGSLEYESTFLSGYFGTNEKARKSGTNNLNNGIRVAFALLCALYNDSAG